MLSGGRDGLALLAAEVDVDDVEVMAALQICLLYRLANQGGIIGDAGLGQVFLDRVAVDEAAPGVRSGSSRRPTRTMYKMPAVSTTMPIGAKSKKAKGSMPP